MSDELDELLHAFAEDALSPERERRLAELLRGSREARTRYLELVELLGGLRWEYAVNAAPSTAAKRRKQPGWILLSAAAAVLVTLGLQAALSPGESVGVVEATGARLRPGPFELESGTAVLRLDNGATLSLRGPARLEIASVDDVSLRLGTVTVRAPAEAFGFRLRTPTSTFIDLGTEFGVSIDENQASEIHVFDGVVVARPRSSTVVVPIHRGEAGRIEANGSDVQPLAVDRRPFPNIVAGAPAAPPLPPSSAPPPLPEGSRVIVLGDRATDKETHLLLIEQALGEAAPALMNAGISFPLLFSEEEFETQVVRLRPTHAVLEFGAELSTGAKPWTSERFEAAMARLLDRLRAAGIEPLVETIWPAGERSASFNAILRRLAAERSLRVADVERRFRDAYARGASLLADERSVPSYQGHRLMAEALLEALGHGGARIPEAVEVAPLEGVPRHWSIRHVPRGEEFDPAKEEPDGSWTPLTLPQLPDKFLQRMADRSQSLAYRDRARGMATNLFRREHELQALAFVEEAEAREAWLNVGGSVRTVWLNGEKVYVRGAHSAWHPGKNRFPARLRAGRNTVVVQAASSFFVSFTRDAAWRLSGERPR